MQGIAAISSEIAKTSQQNQNLSKKKIQEQTAIWPATRRYSHEEWTMFSHCFRLGLLDDFSEEKKEKGSSVLFLAYPAEEPGFSLAKKFFDNSSEKGCYPIDVKWTEIKVHSSSELVACETNDTSAMMDEAIHNRELKVALLISIKKEKLEQLRDGTLKAILNYFYKLLHSIKIYENEFSEVVKSRIKFNMHVLIADVLQAYNDLELDCTDDSFENKIKVFRNAEEEKTLEEAWKARGEEYVADTSKEFASFYEDASAFGFDVSIQKHFWLNLVSVAKEKNDFEKKILALEAFSLLGQGCVQSEIADNDAIKFAKTVNYKAHSYAEKHNALYQYSDYKRSIDKRVKESGVVLKSAAGEEKQSNISHYAKVSLESIVGSYPSSTEIPPIDIIKKKLETELSRKQNREQAPRKPFNYIKREIITREIDNFFCEEPSENVRACHLLILHGFAGNGKTVLASAYYYDATYTYAQKIWLECNAGMVNTLEELKSAFVQKYDENLVGRMLVIVDEIFLQTKKEWNALYALFREIEMPNDVIVTTRAKKIFRNKKDINRAVKIVKVGQYSLKEASDLISLTNKGNNNSDGIKEALTQIECWPLGVDLLIRHFKNKAFEQKAWNVFLRKNLTIKKILPEVKDINFPINKKLLTDNAQMGSVYKSIATDFIFYFSTIQNCQTVYLADLYSWANNYYQRKKKSFSERCVGNYEIFLKILKPVISLFVNYQFFAIYNRSEVRWNGIVKMTLKMKIEERFLYVSFMYSQYNLGESNELFEIPLPDKADSTSNKTKTRGMLVSAMVKLKDAAIVEFAEKDTIISINALTKKSCEMHNFSKKAKNDFFSMRFQIPYLKYSHAASVYVSHINKFMTTTLLSHVTNNNFNLIKDFQPRLCDFLYLLLANEINIKCCIDILKDIVFISAQIANFLCFECGDYDLAIDMLEKLHQIIGYQYVFLREQMPRTLTNYLDNYILTPNKNVVYVSHAGHILSLQTKNAEDYLQSIIDKNLDKSPLSREEAVKFFSLDDQVGCDKNKEVAIENCKILNTLARLYIERYDTMGEVNDLYRARELYNCCLHSNAFETAYWRFSNQHSLARVSIFFALRYRAANNPEEKNEVNQACELLNAVIAYRSQHNETPDQKRRLSNSYIEMGLVKALASRFLEAHHFFSMARDIINSLPTDSVEWIENCWCLQRLGYMYKLKKKYELAFECFYFAWKSVRGKREKQAYYREAGLVIDLLKLIGESPDLLTKQDEILKEIRTFRVTFFKASPKTKLHEFQCSAIDAVGIKNQYWS